ncbi:MAG TPA: hypothetical protein VLH40_01850 [Atribacteraceae bacterium]|nr:hypothetical protein [Atribacteraceae bacterium]
MLPDGRPRAHKHSPLVGGGAGAMVIGAWRMIIDVLIIVPEEDDI